MLACSGTLPYPAPYTLYKKQSNKIPKIFFDCKNISKTKSEVKQKFPEYTLTYAQRSDSKLEAKKLENGVLRAQNYMRTCS